MRVIFTKLAYQKLRAYVENCPVEISGLGEIEKHPDHILIKDIRIFKQEVSKTETIINQKALGKFLDQIVADNGNLANWKLWWHSHNAMAAYFSTVDEATIEDFDNDMSEENWMLSIVTNHAGDIVPQIDIFQPFRATIDKLPWSVQIDDQEIASHDIKKEIEDNVTIIETVSRGNRMSMDFNRRPPHALTLLDFMGDEIAYRTYLRNAGIPFTIEGEIVK